MRKLNIAIKSDKVIWISVVLLAMISVVAVYSSSTYRSNYHNFDKTVVFWEQMKAVIMGLVCLCMAYIIPMRFYRFSAFAIFGICLAMLFALIIPNPFRVYVNGAYRAIKIFGYPIQVFEFVKIGVIFYMAKAVELWQDSLCTFKDYFLKLLMPLLIVALLVMANSFSTAFMIVVIGFVVMFVMGIKLKYLALSICGFVALLAILFASYNLIFADKIASKSVKELNVVESLFNRYGTVQSRVFTHFQDKTIITPEMEKMEKDKEFQIENAKIAISEGGFFGKGPGKSTQRFILPMAFSDFIYASIIEEYGLWMGAGIILIYLIFFFRCIRITSKCTTPFAQTMVFGLSFLIVFQAFLHICVNVGIIPVTGHTLPLISHGGNAYIAFCIAFGVILSVSKQVNKQKLLQEQEALQQDTKPIETNSSSGESTTQDETITQ